MKYSQASLGRVFVVRLEDGDIVHECLERLAREQAIRAAGLIALGDADAGSRLIAGTEEGRANPLVFVERLLDDAHEVAGVGTIFPDEEGNPVPHVHMACGRKDSVVVGCVRAGVKVWHVMEIVVVELLDSTAVRRFEAGLPGFRLLNP